METGAYYVSQVNGRVIPTRQKCYPWQSLKRRQREVSGKKDLAKLHFDWPFNSRGKHRVCTHTFPPHSIGLILDTRYSSPTNESLAVMCITANKPREGDTQT